MTKYFNFYDPLERRYLFNSFLVVVAVVEVLIFVVTCIWQIDEGMFGGPVNVIPFPWQEYLLVAFSAPIALLFLFGVIVRGFQALAPPAQGQAGERPPWFWLRLKPLTRFLLLLLGTFGLFLLLIWGGTLLAGITRLFKALGLWGTYLFAAVVALVCLYVPLRLLLNYRLKKRELDYRYLVYLAERHGVVITDPKNLQRVPAVPAEAQGLGDETASPRCFLPAPEDDSPP